MKITATDYKYRFIARFEVEAETPLAIGSGENDTLIDSPIAIDVNGMPYLPGTSIAGIVRSMLHVDKHDEQWGFQDRKKGHGSEIIFTEGKIIDSTGRVIDGLRDSITLAKDPVLSCFTDLPVRQHVSITEKGVNSNMGKFDEAVLPKGAQFCFEIEVVATSEKSDILHTIVNAVRMQTFRIGSGTRCGFGKMCVLSVKSITIDLSKQLELYLSKPSNLDEAKKWWETIPNDDNTELKSADYVNYELLLEPVDFFLFGSGHGDEDRKIDMTPVYENVIKNGNEIARQTLIPATSVKGALRHRTAFYYNKLVGNHVNNMADAHTNANFAVQKLFGFHDGKSYRGNVLFSDVYLEPLREQVVSHVKINRMSGGAINGALFTESPNYYGNKEPFQFNLQVHNSVLEFDTEDTPIMEALEEALKDICRGMLPLGGGVNRGNGVFRGSIIKNGEKFYEGR